MDNSILSSKKRQMSIRRIISFANKKYRDLLDNKSPTQEEYGLSSSLSGASIQALVIESEYVLNRSAGGPSRFQHPNGEGTMNLFLSMMILGCIQPTQTQKSAPNSFPPIVLSCQNDNNCGVSFHYITDDDRCCSGCSPIVSATSWREETRKICAKKSHEECPMKKCAPPPHVECVQNRCQSKTK